MKNMNKTKILAGLMMSIAMVGCNKESTITGLTSTETTATPTATPAATATPTGDVKKIVTTGPSLSFNALTGGVNDMAVNPVTKFPAMTYYDKSANISGTAAIGALKYAFMDTSGAWNIEVVDFNTGTAACGTAGSFCVGAPNAAAGSTANIIKMAFKSTGEPVIAYVYGASVGGAGFKQIRFAERNSTTGAWSVSVAFSASTAVAASNVAVAATVDPMKSVTLNLDTADRPHITFAFYAQTALANSFIKYLFRSTAGTWASSNITANVTGAGTLAALGQGDNQGGAVMCPLNNQLLSIHQITDGVGGLGKPVFLRCTTVGSGGDCTAWSTLNLVNGCTAAGCFSNILVGVTNSGIRTDITIDAATNRPLVGIYGTTTTPANTLYTGAAPLACDQAQTTTASAWGAAVTVAPTAGSQGLNGFRLSPSTTALNTNYLSYLTSTTGVHVNKATGPTGTWLATAGTVVETTTVAGEGIGAAYEPVNDILYTSYAQLPGGAASALGNDIKMSYGSSADITNSGVAGTLITEVVDNTMSVFPTTAIPSISSAKMSNGTVGYAYFYQCLY